MALQTSSSPSSSSPSATVKQSSFKGANSNNLYLVTFLATLFVLLFISSVIVLRSYILRRRFQRQFNEAVASGLLPFPPSPGSRKRCLGPMPKIYTACVRQGGHHWNQIMPVSVLPVQVKRRNKHGDPCTPSSQKLGSPSSQLPSISGSDSSTTVSRFLRPFRAQHKPALEPPDTAEPEKPAGPKIDMLQVSVFISMPSIHRPVDYSMIKNADDEEDEEMIPEVVFGVTRLPLPEQLTTT
ncbi:hypothetical protein L208DRAFT_669939 [Tricholoma matsutake]|nr:hypothetical protein L208DRAFT_669939 [Tricholoma matsutake 945]